jgi:arylsulfatase A-like enzyme
LSTRRRAFVDRRLQIEFIHFSDPDDMGRSDGWMSTPQFDAVRATDKCLATLLDAVGAAGLDKKTLFIISADHGGYGPNHSGKNEEDLLIPWIAWGRGVRVGHRIKSEISTTDTAVTALWVLGYPILPAPSAAPSSKPSNRIAESAHSRNLA